MADQESRVEQPAPKPAVIRPTADKRYPKYDLITCMAVADKVKNQGGNDCSVDQLGAFLGYTNTNGGGFATKVSNARAFGLIETVQGRYRITPRAETILYPATEAERQQALADAFLAVPMYGRVYEMHRGSRLPEALGMKNLLHREFGVPMGDQVTLALRVMMDSAEQAGMFQATQGQRTKLVLPVIGTAPPPDGHSEQRDKKIAPGGGGGDENGGGDGKGADTRGLGVLVNGVIAELPKSDSWDEQLFQTWLDMMELALRVRYKLPRPK
jgi:hypothetical protein